MKKKVLFVNNRLGYYGAENVLINLVNHLDLSRYDITVLTLLESDNSRLVGGIRYKSIFSKGNLFTKVVNKIKLLCGWKCLARRYCNGYDVAVAFKMGECANLASCCNAPKKLCWIHSNVSEIEEPFSYSFSNLAEEQACLKKFTSLIAVSKSCAESFYKKYSFDYNTKVIFNPVDANNILEKSSESLSAPENEIFKGDVPIIGTVARIDSQKGIDRLIHISKQLTQEKIRHKLVIIGDGVDYKKYVKQVESEHLENIFLLGFKYNPYKYMVKFDLFVCSSIWESYSLVVNEALVLGIPVISTKCGGPEEVLRYGKYGILTENNEEALFESVKRFLMSGKGENEVYNPAESMRDFITAVEKAIEGN